MKKYCIIFLLTLLSVTACRENKKPNQDAKISVSTYTLPIPKGWTTELFMIPISFAPEIPYKGVEDLRFSGGWGNAKSSEYWSYAFLWYLDSAVEINAGIIEKNMASYYAGLIASNIEKRRIPADKIFPPKTSIEKIKTDAGDIETFQGTIYMLDYMEQKPITLNCIVHLKSCPEKNKTFLFHEISPKPFTDSVWQTLNQLNKDLTCNQK